MSETLIWWLMLQVVTLAALPLCLTLFRGLPDRGYALSKAFALILVGYLFWISNVAHILPNTSAGIWIVLLLLVAASALLLLRKRNDLAEFARERWWLIAATEIVFFLTFITAAFLRSFVSDLGGTEKPMDFMFLNAVTHGKHFPPPDPWLAGKNISYYYFGYLIVSIMTRLSALETSIGFNLGLAMIVALAVTGAFGLVYNLAAPGEEREREAGPGTPAAGLASHVLWRPIIFGVIAGFLLAVIGNAEGLLEALASHGASSQGFWSWVHVDPTDLLSSEHSTHWYPDHFWFWWRATRILDNGVGIHEFPFFSFLLGDLHPHVMSIPFVLLTLGVAQLLLRSDEPLDLVVWLERPLALAAFAIILGGLAFLNTWDMPTMAFVVALVALLRNRLHAERWSWDLALDTAGFVLPLFVAALLAYAPFFVGGFTSQAAGFTAEAGTGSGLFHTLLIWGPLAVLVLPYAFWRLRQSGKAITRQEAIWALAPAAVILALWVVWDLFGANRDRVDPNIIHPGFAGNALLGWLPRTVLLNDGRYSLLHRIGNRGWNWLTFLLLAGVVGMLGMALVREVETAKRAAEERLAHVYALALSATAALLILGSEFFYIQDSFGSRMNTIFKLYYQSWLLLSVAGGFALFEMVRGWRPALPRPSPGAAGRTLPAGWSIGELVVVASTIAGGIIGIVIGHDAFARVVGLLVGSGVFFAVSVAAVLIWRSTDAEEGAPAPSGALSWRAAWRGMAAAFLVAAFVYPIIATYNRTNGFSGTGTLDGMDAVSPDQRAAIEWLSGRAGQPVIAEAPGDDYKIETGGLFSASTGLPTIVQWTGHELQWRGTVEGLDPRKTDVETLYTSSTPGQVQAILQRYNIRYVIVGPAERQKYPNLKVNQMNSLLVQAFPAQGKQGEVTIYQVQPGILTGAAQE